jgi:hypothetical protein
MKKPHIHADVIKAWADGAEIEICMNTFDVWIPVAHPNWLPDMRYRVQPEPQPNTRHHLLVTCKDGRSIVFGPVTSSGCPCDNLRLTFDGETNKLIKAEVLK